MRTARIITTPLAALVAAGALAGPAMARIDPPPDWSAPAPIRQAPVYVTRSGLDWGSIGIGTAAGIGASAIAIAGTAGMRHRGVARRAPRNRIERVAR
jgi:hypothetical protein